MKLFVHLYSVICIAHFATLCGENMAMYASFFNATYSCNNPLVLNGTVTIYLDQDIVINQCIPFVAGPLLSPSDQLIFTSQDSHKLIIQSNTIFNLTTFLPQQQSLVFMGNAYLIVEQGAYIIFDQHAIIAKQQAHISFVKSAA